MYILLKKENKENVMNEKHVVTKNANNTEKDITPCAESLGVQPEVKSGRFQRPGGFVLA